MFKKGLCVIFLGAFLLVGMAWALDYSAKAINVTMRGTKEITTMGKVYFSKDKMRSEGEVDKGKKAITIFRYDKKVMWILMPEEKAKEKMYMERKIPMDKLIAAMSELEKEKKIKVYRKKVGKAKISGILCDKYKITTKDLTEKKPKTYTMYQWISRKHKKLIMKTLFEDGSYTLIKDVKFKKQPAHLFEIPKGYQCVTVQPGEEVVRAGFGSGPDDLGRSIADESNPEGPMSFVIGGEDNIYILDQLNSRVQVFQNGTRISTIPILANNIPIPAETFEDIDLNQQGSIILLDRFVYETVAFFDASGNLQKQADLIGEGITEGGGISGIDSRDDGVWVRIGSSHSVRVTDANGDPVEARTLVEGRFSVDGQYQLKYEVLGEVTAVVQRSRTGSARWETFYVLFDKPIFYLTGLYTDSDNRIYLGAYLSEDGKASEVVVVLGSDGQEEQRVWMPAATGVEEIFRTMRVTSDGVIYQLAIDETGVVVRRYVP